jgi:hypothetical protein
MISGTFHVMSQEWRYYSREKSLFHTLHVGQLPSGTAGDTIEIAATSPANPNNGSSSNNFSVPTIPGIGGVTTTNNVTITANTLSDCFASVGPGQTILTNKNCIIQYGVWSSTLKEIYITPQKGGWFMLGGGFTSTEQNGVYQTSPGGTTYDAGTLTYGFANTINGNIDRQPVGFTATQVGAFGRFLNVAQGNYAPNIPPNTGAPNAPNTPWNPNFYLSSIISDDCIRIFEGIAGRFFRFQVRNTSNPANDFDMSAWLFKFAEL